MKVLLKTWMLCLLPLLACLISLLLSSVVHSRYIDSYISKDGLKSQPTVENKLHARYRLDAPLQALTKKSGLVSEDKPLKERDEKLNDIYVLNIISARITWGSSVALFVFACCLSYLIGISILYRIHNEHCYPRWPSLPCIGSAIVMLLPFIFLCGTLLCAKFLPVIYIVTMHLLAFTLHSDSPAIYSIATSISVGGLSAAIFLCGVACTLLLPSSYTETDDYSDSTIDPKEAEKQATSLSLRIKRMNFLLYAGSLLLTAAVFQWSSLYQLALSYAYPSNMKVDEKLLKSFLSLGSSLATWVGIDYTRLLCAIYIPTAAILQYRAIKLADSVLKDQPEGFKEEWLKKRGLAFSTVEQLPRFLALLTPLVVTPISAFLK